MLGASNSKLLRADITTGELQPLRVEDQVHFQTSYGPKPGSLLQSWNYRRYPPMCYIVRSNGGAEYHRNRRFLINHPVDQCHNQICPKFRNIITVKKQSKWPMSIRTKKILLPQPLQKPRVMRGYRKQPTSHIRSALVELTNHRRDLACKLFHLWVTW